MRVAYADGNEAISPAPHLLRRCTALSVLVQACSLCPYTAPSAPSLLPRDPPNSLGAPSKAILLPLLIENGIYKDRRCLSTCMTFPCLGHTIPDRLGKIQK